MTADEIQSDFKNGPYRIDREYSVIEWTGRNPDTEHVGTLGFAAGRLVVAGTKITGEFKIDMNTLKSTSLRGHELRPVLEAHLKSHDFFFVKLFPWAWFRLLQAAPSGRTNRGRSIYDVRGELEVCGESVPLTFSACLHQLENGGLEAKANLELDRTWWGLIYGSRRFFKDTGVHAVNDLIGIRLKTRLVPG